MKIHIAALFVLGIAFPALAQAQTDYNEFGVYFDEGGETYATSADPSSVVDAYLVLWNPSESGDVRFWTATISSSSEQTYYDGPAIIAGIPRQGINEWNPMAGEQDVTFYVFCEAPQLPSLEPMMVLADLEIRLLGETNPVEIFFTGHLAYTLDEFIGWFDSNLIEGNPVSGNRLLPVASINGSQPVPVTSSSWGGVKALFRN